MPKVAERGRSREGDGTYLIHTSSPSAFRLSLSDNVTVKESTYYLPATVRHHMVQRVALEKVDDLHDKAKAKPKSVPPVALFSAYLAYVPRPNQSTPDTEAPPTSADKLAMKSACDSLCVQGAIVAAAEVLSSSSNGIIQPSYGVKGVKPSFLIGKLRC